MGRTTHRKAKSIRTAAILMLATMLQACGMNNIPAYDEAAKAAWGQVESQYQRRADLIPNLVEVVKGYASHEKEVLVQVTEARAKVSQMTLPKDMISNPAAFKQFQANQDGLSNALSRLMVVVEKYPDLKANQNFQELQSQIEGTENRIAVARRDYIAAVQRLNTEIRTFPGLLWAKIVWSDVKSMEQFTATKEAQQAPVVNFSK